MINLSRQTDQKSHSEQPSIPEQVIRERAYEIYVHRGAKGGNAVGDWLTAEAELKEAHKHVLTALSQFR
jgi:hypothetical protein